MEAMCDWCGQVVPIGLDGACFLGHPVSVPPSTAGTPELDIATPPPPPLDTVAPVPDFATVPALPQPAPPQHADIGPVPAALPPQPPVFAGTPAVPAAPQPPHAPIVPPPMPSPPVPVGAGALAGPGPTASVAEPNPVDAAFAPLTGASSQGPLQAGPQPQAFTQVLPAQPQVPPGLALPPQAPTGPGWQAVHIADDVAVFEYRPPGGAVSADDVVAQLPPPPGHPGAAGPEGAGVPVSPPDVASFAPGDELDIPDKGSKTRQILLLAILAIVALGAAVAFAFGLI